MPTNVYLPRDNRRILFMNIYPRRRSEALAFLGCNVALSSYRSNASPLDTREDGPTSSGNIGVDAPIFQISEAPSPRRCRGEISRAVSASLLTRKPSHAACKSPCARGSV
jgi:hypothetical protein